MERRYRSCRNRERIGRLFLLNFFCCYIFVVLEGKNSISEGVCVLMCVVGTKEGLARGKLYFVAVVRVVVVVDFWLLVNSLRVMILCGVLERYY